MPQSRVCGNVEKSLVAVRIGARSFEVSISEIDDPGEWSHQLPSMGDRRDGVSAQVSPWRATAGGRAPDGSGTGIWQRNA